MEKTGSQKDLSRKLVRLYILALSGVAIFLIISQILVQISISEQQNDARVVNIAGRQRMLSQKLCKTAILLTHNNIYQSDSLHYAQDINSIIELWSKCHKGLKSGVLQLETTIPVKNSHIIDSMFTKIDPIFSIIISNAGIIRDEIEHNSAQNTVKTEPSLAKMLENEKIFLQMMDKIVFQYDAEAKARIEKLKKIEYLLFGLTIFILILEGLFIFKPTYKQINHTIFEIKASETKYQELNFQLQNTNASLIKAEKELLNATEEKYKLQMKEDKIRSASLIEGQEEERKRISLELHDGIGQMLTGLKLISEKLGSNVFELEKDKKSFDDLKQLLYETIAETRVISFNLMPSVLNDFGIVSAIKLLAEQTEKNASTKIIFKHFMSEIRFSKNIEITLYRIAQEAINNAIKYAEANLIEIDLINFNTKIELSIKDYGKGFDMRKLKKQNLKNGINNMRSRTEINGGEFKITSSKGKGTKIYVKIDLEG